MLQAKTATAGTWRRDEQSVAPTPAQLQAAREKRVEREQIKLLTKVEAAVVECERRIARQAAVIAELRGSGLPTVEAERSLERLEAAAMEQRAQRDQVVSVARGAGSDAGQNQPVA